jgi:hypothetical protein
VTRIFGDPTAFAEDALAGFVAAYPGYVARVDGGVVINYEFGSRSPSAAKVGTVRAYENQGRSRP